MQTEQDLATFELKVPDGAALGQDQEWCEVSIDGETRRIRFHDYAEIYSIPGLYERLFYEELECASPKVIRSMLETELESRDVDPAKLQVVDVGAGNGMVGEELADLGVGGIIGVDIIEEAAAAAERDRPGTYEEYLVTDLTDPSPEAIEILDSTDINCMTSVAALGFGDIPPVAFAKAFNSVESPGWVAFNIKEDFLEDRDPTGFNLLVREMFETNIVEPVSERRYRHRLAANGEPLYYKAFIAEKQSDIPTL